MKLSVKLLSGLVLVALVAVAVIGLSNSASATVDGKIYVTNVASNLTSEPGQNIDDDGRLTVSTVYGTYASDETTGVTARDIVANSDVFIVTVVDDDLNTTTTLLSDRVGDAGYASGSVGSDVVNVQGTLFDDAGDKIQVTLSDQVGNPIVGEIGDIKVLDHGTTDEVTGVSVFSIGFIGDEDFPAFITLIVNFAGSAGGTIDIEYPTSSVEEISATIKSVVDEGGTSVVTLTETGRDTGRFEGFVRVLEQTTTFVTGEPGNGLDIDNAATIPSNGGLIKITYVDAFTSGTAVDQTREARYTIDKNPPTATINTPLSGSESQNRFPTFSGNVTDNESGLDIDRFALIIDEAANETTFAIAVGESDDSIVITGDIANIDFPGLSDGVNTLAFSYTSNVLLPTGLPINTVPDNTLDFQVQAADLAGNFGYSDSDTSLGDIEDSGRHGNQPHEIKIDQKIPEMLTAETGLAFNVDDEDEDLKDVRDTIKLTFNGKMKESSVSPSDFKVVFDGAGGTFVPASVIVNGSDVYLDLDSNIPSDNEPTITIQGTVQDLAGNSTDAGSAVADDKLAPVVDVTQSGGSGSGTGDEAADNLTADKMTITVTTDEDLLGSPTITVTDIKSDGTPVFAEGNVLDEQPTISQGGNTWTFEVTGSSSPGGSRAVRVNVRDLKNNPVETGDDTTGAYILDPKLETPSFAPKTETTESNPFITVDFAGATGFTAEQSTVTITSATLQEEDGAEVDVTSQVIASANGKTFFFQPTAALNNAEYTYVVKAVDAAGNEDTFENTFDKSDRTDFEIELFAGWNVVSVPSNPLVTDIGSVLSNVGIKQVVAFDATTPSQPWRIASKVGSGPYSSQTTPGLTTITAGSGYWIETSDFEDQKIALEGSAGPGDARPGLTTIATGEGWNLVGVVDQSRKQTQSGNKGKTLTRPKADGSEGPGVTVATYFNTVNNGRAYVFNTVQSQFNELLAADFVTIGSGIWVFVSPQTGGDLPPIVP